MQTIIALGVIAVLGYFAYRSGKRVGSRLGYGVGRYRRR